MRVAFVVSNITYPPISGLHQQTVLTAQIQLGGGNELHLLGFCRDLRQLDQDRMMRETGLRFYAPPINTRLPSILLGLVNRFVPSFLRSREVRRLQASLSSNYDVIHLENIAACGLVRRATSRRTILGVIDPGTLRWRRMAATAKNLRLKLRAHVGMCLNSVMDKAIMYPGIRLQVVSNEDAIYLQERLPQVRVTAVPVALPANIHQISYRNPEPKARCVGVVFLDLREPHIRQSFLWFIHSVYRPLRTRGCLFDLLVLGRIGRDAEIEKHCLDLPVTLLAMVDDYLAVLAGADFIIIPDLVGTGLKNRVIQGMALGQPVVGTPVAFEGIPARNGVHALVSATAEEMMKGLIDLCNEPIVRRTLGENAKELMSKEYGTEVLKGRWMKLYKSVVSPS
jgi:glycosyltransferase involved in cell wall biosynthesis